MVHSVPEMSSRSLVIHLFSTICTWYFLTLALVGILPVKSQNCDGCSDLTMDCYDLVESAVYACLVEISFP